MPSWDSSQYLRFAAERTRPAKELAARIEVDAPGRVMDLGCGPGNSTEVLAQRWPDAELWGLDGSASMLDAARRAHPDWRWAEGDVGTWTADAPFDVVVANAVLQWVPDHARLFPRLLAQVAPGGALAFQVPDTFDSPPHRLLRAMGAEVGWAERLRLVDRPWHVETPRFYLDLVVAHGALPDIWVTEYLHLMDGVDAIIDWYRGTGLRPWLEALPDEVAQTEFLAEYRTRLAPSYPQRSDGRVVFPFRRIFVVAYR